jgi:hypothetical protein
MEGVEGEKEKDKRTTVGKIGRQKGRKEDR